MFILWREGETAKERHGWLVGRYVIMSDHVHIFCVEAAGGSRHSLSRFVGAWKEWTAKELIRTLPTTTPVWQKRFFDHVLRSEESYAEKWEYVRDNPVRAGLVVDSNSWPFQGFVDFDLPRGG
jgi:putative transposase